MVKLVIASDHAGFALKEHLKKTFADIEWIDVGPHNEDSVDYPDYADLAVLKMLNLKTRGVLVCGSGQGMCMRANKYREIRAALAWDKVSAQLAREHNDSNILCLGGRLIPHDIATDIFSTWLNTEFAGGRHAGRVNKISSPTK
jgi:ribose 5-phosphate isomerase B